MAVQHVANGAGRNEAVRETLVDALVHYALAALSVNDVEALPSGTVGAAELLALVADQDVEEGDGGFFRIVRGCPGSGWLSGEAVTPANTPDRDAMQDLLEGLSEGMARLLGDALEGNCDTPGIQGP